MPLEGPVTPLPEVTMLPLPEVEAVASKKKVPEELTEEGLMVIVESVLSESVMKAEPLLAVTVS